MLSRNGTTWVLVAPVKHAIYVCACMYLYIVMTSMSLAADVHAFHPCLDRLRTSTHLLTHSVRWYVVDFHNPHCILLATTV